MCFYRGRITITWTERVSYKTMAREKTMILKMRKEQLEFLGYITRKDGLENVTLTRHRSQET